MVPFLFCYKIEVFASKLIPKPKNLDLSYKTDLDFLDYFGTENNIQHLNYTRLGFNI